VVQRITARARSLYEDAKVCARLRLPDEIIERLRADRGIVPVHLPLAGGHEAIVHHGLVVHVFARSVKTVRAVLASSVDPAPHHPVTRR
jgi:hypothetical protein